MPIPEAGTTRRRFEGGLDRYLDQARQQPLLGAEEERVLAERWRAELGDRAVVRTQDGIEDWFGPIEDRVRPRIGDVVVAALDDFAVFSSRDFAIEFHMVGFHGSITDVERSVPLLIAP